ncbi:uncharacterized protein N7482_007608 [Penicillium canariense]|uniref:Uncharacterized protein n=1 Tax=Penicillium canariense TaxID=189055 RepID=A0A9W9HX50_9EURO|nr:uncharacterized protein N7482_007608 [Penicillium canariense]KAJ5160604.1 hypothetical protein N7482_007608 [Penicillium canariense]
MVLQSDISPRIRPGRLVLSIRNQIFQRIHESWNLHPRTIEIFLSNNGALSTFYSSGRTLLVMKVANSCTTGFDCVSVSRAPSRRTTSVLYHHLFDEDAVFTTLLSTPERCINFHFFIAALYRSHHQHIEIYRNTIDDKIAERATNGLWKTPGGWIKGVVLGRTSIPPLMIQKELFNSWYTGKLVWQSLGTLGDVV